MTTGIQLIVGLGNPGPQYAATRHNVGAWLIQSLADTNNSSFKHEPKFKGEVATVSINNQDCRILFPLTFMNLSGEAVRAYANFYKIPAAAILVAHDELDFPPGIARLKFGGSANSHNGVQNIIDHLGDNNFLRLRIGIGKPAFKGAMKEYVLQKPPKAEVLAIEKAIADALEIVPLLLKGDMQTAMQQLHGGV